MTVKNPAKHRFQLAGLTVRTTPTRKMSKAIVNAFVAGYGNFKKVHFEVDRDAKRVEFYVIDENVELNKRRKVIAWYEPMYPKEYRVKGV